MLPFLSCCLRLEKIKHICQYKSKGPDEKGPWLQLHCALPAQEPALGISFIFHFQSFSHLLHSSFSISCYQLFFPGKALEAPSCLSCCLMLPDSSSSVCKDSLISAKIVIKNFVFCMLMCLPSVCQSSVLVLSPPSLLGHGWQWCGFGF